MADRKAQGTRSPVSIAAPREEQGGATLATANFAIGWVFTALIAPLLFLAAALVPADRAVATSLGLSVGATGIVTLVLSYRHRLVAAGLFLTSATWVILSVTAWFNGGEWSGAAALLPLVIVFAAVTRGWRWGLAMTALAVATILVLVAAEISGHLPKSTLPHTPITQGIALVACLLGVGLLQAFLARSVLNVRRRAGREIAERRIAEQRLLDVVDSAPFGALVCELHRDGRLLVVHANPSASRVLGTDANRFVGQHVSKAFSALSVGTTLEAFKRIAENGGTYDAEAVPYYAEGRQGTLEMHAFQIGERSMAVYFTDVTKRRREQVQIHHAAFHDELTRLPNRKLLLDRLTVAIAAANRRHCEVALLFLDLDQFKPINDRYGHTVGDELLIAVSQRLLGCARASDTVARLGGDEFTVLMPDVQRPDQVETVAAKVMAAFESPFEVAEHRIRISASIGISVTNDEERDPSRLLEHADLAMYRMKAEGRHGYRMYQAGLRRVGSR